MGLLDRFRPQPDPMVEVLQESVADLSLRLEDRGWKKVGDDEEEMTREALRVAASDARALSLAHPLVRRGLSLRTAYVHGNGGPQVTVEDQDDTQDVSAVVQDWWGDRSNRAALTGPEARARLERSLATDGNVFITAFTNPQTGRVLCRTIPFDQIDEVITNPEDRLEPWFYQRTYTRAGDTTARTVYHPALAYAPTRQPRFIDGHEVLWGQPVRHVKVNDLDGWTLGLGDLYSIAPYARSYRDFLQDWAKLTRSLAQFAWKATADGKRAGKAAQALSRINTSVPGNPGSVGAGMVMGAGETLEAIPKTGATIDAESGRPLLAMIAAGLDVPVTMLSADPGVTGARATAETLDEPMYLAMGARRDVWTAVYEDLAQYVIEQAIRTPQGPLTGEIVRDDWTRTDAPVIAGVPPVITVSWPDLSTNTMAEMLDSLSQADSMKLIPPVTLTRLVCVALGVEDVDAVIDEVTDDDGDWRDPYAQTGAQLTDALRAGVDPASVLGQYGRFGPADDEAEQ
jgi:hypothetical protein